MTSVVRLHTIPEILRWRQISGGAAGQSQYAITARVSQLHGNKLLVLIDGRPVYTPLFSGVFWEMRTP